MIEGISQRDMATLIVGKARQVLEHRPQLNAMEMGQIMPAVGLHEG